VTVRATARERGPAFDLLAAWAPGGFFFERRGEGVAGTGRAASVAVDGGPGRFARLARAVEATFASVSRSGEDAAPLVAVGGASFDGARGAELVVLAHAVVRGEGGSVEVTIGDISDGAVAATSFPAVLPSDPFADLRSEPSEDAYRAAVARATSLIRAGSFEKVVLARSIVVEAGRDLDVRALLARLRAVDPEAYTFATADGDATLVGASPELLVRKSGRRVETTPLAGSAPRGSDESSDRLSASRLAASAKDLEEHRYVVEDVAAALGPLCSSLSFPSSPELVRTANVWHLATPFVGDLREDVASVLDVLDALHPTAAVSGLPRAAAAAALRDLEPLDRGGYAGPVGWVDDRGDGEFAIALRCARVESSRARLFAGAGIVAGSDPEAELEETARKFRAFLDALRWG
jgi:menaquinone-specific isochorismate synthase